VIGDGNCFYRAVCVAINGSQDSHASLRKQLADYVSSLPASSDACVPLKRLAADIQKAGSWAGEDVILATANFLQRPLHVYCASGITSPMVYTPEQSITRPQPLHIVNKSTSTPINIAFYEPGHYQAVIDSASVSNLGNGLTPVKQVSN
jgi:hypothetical protein